MKNSNTNVTIFTYRKNWMLKLYVLLKNSENNEYSIMKILKHQTEP